MQSSSKLEPFRLAPLFRERIWGKLDLEPWYGSTGTSEPVGEAWLTGAECLVETGPCAGRSLASVVEEFGVQVTGVGSPGEFPLLIKMLFPSDKLSVQVHPDDSQAQAMGQSRGKTECWYVLEAEPGATVALGLRPGVEPSQVREAVIEGTLEDLVEHIPVGVGDMVFVDAGTVHAIGPGLVLLETQQTCDVTYRLYDYGRPRELHLEQGLAVMKTQTRAGKVSPHRIDGFTRLIEEQYFTVDRVDLTGEPVTLELPGAGCLVALQGSGTANGIPFTAGQAVVIPVGSGPVRVESTEPFSFVRCFAPVA